MTNNIKGRLNIVWYVLCWNEMPILPFMIDYWKLIARKVIVIDNNSTDGTLEYLKAFDWIEVRPYPYATNDTLNDDINRKIKNECWKEQKGKGVDFVIVSDLDEILWAKDLGGLLEYVKEYEMAVIRPTGYDFVSQKFPIHGNMLLHEQVKNCCRIENYDKCIVFQPDLVDEMNYSVGSHSCNPTTSYKIVASSQLYLFHFKYLSPEYLIMKRFATKDRMSDINIQKNWGFEYKFNKEQIMQQFEEKCNECMNFEKILK